MSLLTKEKLESIRLKQEEVATLNTFMGVSVRKNYSYTMLTNKAGVSMPMDIQQLYNQNIETLNTYGKLLTAEIAKQGSADFDPLKSGNTAYMTPGRNEIPATEMTSTLGLIIREKTYEYELARIRIAITRKKTELEGMATPDELKAKTQEELKALEAHLG